MNRFRPAFNHLIHPLNCDGLATRAACEQEVVVTGIDAGQIRLQGSVNAFVYHQDILFAGFALTDIDGLSGLQKAHLPDS